MADIPANLNTSQAIMKYWSENKKPHLAEVSDALPINCVKDHRIVWPVVAKS